MVGQDELVLKDKNEIILDAPNFKDKNGKWFLVRCPRCGYENWGPAVASGICSWCGFDANKFAQEHGTNVENNNT